MALNFIDNFLFGALRNVWTDLIFPVERYFFLTSSKKNPKPQTQIDVAVITSSIVPLPWRCEHSLASADVTSLTVLDSLKGKISPPSSQYEVYPQPKPYFLYSSAQ